MNNKKYNGWVNWETWNAKVWLDNNEATYYTVLDLIASTNNAVKLADKIKDFWVNAHEAGWKTDEMSQHRIDWHEIAEAYLEESR